MQKSYHGNHTQIKPTIKLILITDRVRSTREGNIFSLFVCSHQGGYPVQPGGGTLSSLGGVPCPAGGGTLAWPGGYPDQLGGYPVQLGGYPVQPGGYPVQLGGGTLAWPGGYPVRQSVHPTPRSVCLLRSCRRTFLY